MLQDIVAVKPVQNYQLHLTFEDHKEGIVDLAEIIEFSGIFEPLKNPAYFATVQVDPDLGTLCWDNGADIDPVVLYTKLSNPAISLSDIRDRVLPQILSDKALIGDTQQSIKEVL